MSSARFHAEWLGLVDVSGPFLSIPVLEDFFPQGLAPVDTRMVEDLRTAWEEWSESVAEVGDASEIHLTWIDWVLTRALEFDDECLVSAEAVPEGYSLAIPEHGLVLRPDLAVVDQAEGDDAPRSRLLVMVCRPGQEDLDGAVAGDSWSASPAERMVALLKATGVRLGLVTNGEKWMVVDAPAGTTSGFATWHARLWFEERPTLNAFVELLGIRRFFGVAEDETLEALLEKSAEFQEHLTDQLGLQVRSAVEVLVQALDKADLDSGRILLGNVNAGELYEAAVTVMMRLVFLLCAEERGLLLVGDETWDRHYAITGVRARLQAEADEFGLEVLERRRDAWPRLLSTFRAVFGGVEHDELRLRPYGGSLFDPDRFPFLEGRPADTSWRETDADPLPVDNRTVLHLLESLQLLQVGGRSGTETRRLSFRELDVENIGYVYEGLLDHLAMKVKAPTLGLHGASGKEPEIELDKLEAARKRGEKQLIELLKEETGRSISALTNGLAAEIDEDRLPKLHVACGHDDDLVERAIPFLGLVRDDVWGYPAVWREGSWMVTGGPERRETGTHYTPKPLTEAIVRETLEPIIYVGSAEGTPRDDWDLKGPEELLGLKICDPAMGSGAFLVQACRYLGDRLVESWAEAEKAGEVIGLDGVPVDPGDTVHLMPKDADERLAIARRLVAERCLYGVDINPMAVEMAKLSIWLFTLSGNRPFGFLDHALRPGDSLLGVRDIRQLRSFHPDPVRGEALHRTLLGRTKGIDEVVKKAVAARVELETMRVLDIEDVHRQEALHDQTERSLEDARLVADLLMGAMLATAGEGAGSLDSVLQDLGVRVGELLDAESAGGVRDSLIRRAREDLDSDLPAGKRSRRPLHWVLEFPEVFLRKNPGFDGIVGNPPFMGGRLLGRRLGMAFQEYLNIIRNGVVGSPDLCVYFFLRAFSLIKLTGFFGLLATKSISETGSRVVCLDQLISFDGVVFRADARIPWPGKASVVVSIVWVSRGKWEGSLILNGREVTAINGALEADLQVPVPLKLKALKGRFSQGQDVMGRGFELNAPERDEILSKDPKCNEVIFPFFNGQDLNTMPVLQPRRWVIYFRDWPESKARQYGPAFERVEKLVKPYRDSLTGQIHQDCFWKFWDLRPVLMSEFSSKSRVMAMASVTKYLCVSPVSTDAVYNMQVKILFFDGFFEFAVLQSSIHDVWARWRGGTLGSSTLRYSTSAILETWPMPPMRETAALEGLGLKYAAVRDAMRKCESKGLTQLYNSFHNCDVRQRGIEELRQIHQAIDVAVVRAYGWDDLDLGHGFYEVPNLPDGDNVQFTISEQARREVLRRLSVLNLKRYEEEVRQGLHNKVKERAPGRTKSKAPAQRAQISWLDKEHGQPETDEELGYEIASIPAIQAAEKTAPEYGDETAAVLGWLEANPGWHAKAEIVAGARIDESSWTKTINSLLGNRQIERKGKKRATRYRAKIETGREDPEAPTPRAAAQKRPETVKHEASAAKKKGSAKTIDGLVLEWLSSNPQWHPVVRIASGVKATQGEVIRALNGLVSSGQVQFRTGNLNRGEYRKA